MYQLQKIKRKNLDLEKYSKAINEALNYRIYAEYWYLDILTEEKWECWIWGDYEAVMPIPLQYKFGFKFVLQPIYCQQLGVFYKEEIPDTLFREFEKKLHQYRVRSYCFNEENTERYNPKGQKKVNYVLDLNRPYEEIFEDYSRNKRRDVRKSKRMGTMVERSDNLQRFLDLHNENYQHLAHLLRPEITQKILHTLLKKEKLILYEVFDKSDNLIAVQVLAAFSDRVLYLGLARDKKTENHNASSRALDFFIENYAGRDLTLDFEGSANPKIAHFMEGFGAEKKIYTVFKNFNFSFYNFKKKFLC